MRNLIRETMSCSEPEKPDLLLSATSPLQRRPKNGQGNLVTRSVPVKEQDLSKATMYGARLQICTFLAGIDS